MKVMNPMSWGAALGAGFLATVVMLPTARGELVYENQVAPAAVQDREATRQVLGSSQRAQATVQSQYAATEPAQAVVVQAPTPVIMTQPAASQPIYVQQQPQAAATEVTTTVEVQNLSKSEMMRRERTRHELKNEDILQERLEELRLRDERARTDQLLGVAPAPAQAAPISAPAPVMTQEYITAPVTDRPGQPAATGSLVASRDAAALSYAAASEQDDEQTTIMLLPRIGISNMNGNEQFNVQSRYTGGIGLGVGVSDTVTFEMGYQYAEYGIAMASTNPWVTTYQGYYNGGYYNQNQNFETLVMKQNVFDGGLKLYFLGPQSKLRPFVGGGAGYSKSYINYDQRIVQNLHQQGLTQMAQDYEASSYLGYLQTGFDVKLSKSVTIGGLFKYYTVFSARENQPINNAQFGGQGYAQNGAYNPYGYGAYPYNGYYAQPYYANNQYNRPDAEKHLLGGSLARSSFYNIMATLSFSF